MLKNISSAISKSKSSFHSVSFVSVPIRNFANLNEPKQKKSLTRKIFEARMDQKLLQSELKHQLKEGEIKHTYFDYPVIMGKFLIGANVISVLLVVTGTNFEYFTPGYKDFKCMSFDVLGYFFALTVKIQTSPILLNLMKGGSYFGMACANYSRNMRPYWTANKKYFLCLMPPLAGFISLQMVNYMTPLSMVPIAMISFLTTWADFKMTVESSGPGYWFIYKMKMVFAMNTFLFFTTIGILKLREFYITGDNLLAIYENKVQSYLKDKNIEAEPKEKPARKKLIQAQFTHTEEMIDGMLRDPRR